MDSISDLTSLGLAKVFKVVHLNVRSILKKIDHLRLVTQDLNIDVFTVSETWLKRHLVDIQGFKAYRLDRDSGKGEKKRGGGLLT